MPDQPATLEVTEETDRRICGRFVGGTDTPEVRGMCIDDQVNARRRAMRAALLAIRPEDILGGASSQGSLLNWADFQLRKWMRDNATPGMAVLEGRLGGVGSVAIVGSGASLDKPGLLEAIKEQKPSVIIAINRTSQRIPSQEWQALREAIPGVLLVAAQMDPGVALPGGESLVVPVGLSCGIDLWITSTTSDYLFPSSLPRTIVPQHLPAGPSGSQGVLVWVSRILGAKSAVCYCCDGVNGDRRHAFGEQKNAANYPRHAQRAWTYARDMPLRWVHPKGIPAMRARIVQQLLGPNGVPWPAFSPKDWGGS
jgi:hypothetical protein